MKNLKKINYKLNLLIFLLIYIFNSQSIHSSENKIIFKRIHGWKYSYNYEKTSYLSIWNKKNNLGVCADWFSGPKVENAWLSANDLAKKIK